MNKIRQAEDHIKPSGLPVRCSSCFGQYPSRKHVDFGAACDRGWYGGEGANDVTMDDLIICDHCLAEAARIIGWMPVSEVKAKLERHDGKLNMLEKENERYRRYTSTLEKALRDHPGGEIRIDHRKKPRGVERQPA